MVIIESLRSQLPVPRVHRHARRELGRDELRIRRQATVEREQRELAWLIRSQLHGLS